MAVLLETSLGDIVVDLKVDQAPRTCTNFVKLCKIKYYNNCLIHTVQKDYIAQTGDPTNTGKGGSSIHAKLPGLAKRFFDDEITPALKHNVRGTVAMANEKPNENASQFYITLREEVEHLDGKHTIFGSIAEGQDVLDKINNAMVDENNAPFQNIRIWHTEILDDPFDDPDGLAPLIPPKSPEVIKDEELKKMETAADEAELEEKMASTLAKSQATTLELLHDIPDADIAVPESDLFIYKLNPVTQDGDLELIFSRFGPIKSCEIVRDWKTGDSLQYGFITFENVRDCENAYFKMHDCVIDDRRIGVNFSQSVAKLWNKHRTGARASKDDVMEAQKGGRGKGRGKGGKGGKGRGAGDAGAPPLLLAKEEAPRDKAAKREAPAPARGRPRSPSGGADRRERRPRSRSRDRRERGGDRDRRR
ncbi:unnamed protein product [Prorocentrum cordatum]|uniref:Peptidyl-prolyl cis-trans isomerase n=1 Tax=Prorocentrum cordatum TaxID=2364126 RepID=A0ABN9QRV1_9DINO|nr:unnamed protein product [Polarella glacialis]